MQIAEFSLSFLICARVRRTLTLRSHGLCHLSRLSSGDVVYSQRSRMFRFMFSEPMAQANRVLIGRTCEHSGETTFTILAQFYSTIPSCGNCLRLLARANSPP